MRGFILLVLISGFAHTAFADSSGKLLFSCSLGGQGGSDVGYQQVTTEEGKVSIIEVSKRKHSLDDWKLSSVVIADAEVFQTPDLIYIGAKGDRDLRGPSIVVSSGPRKFWRGSVVVEDPRDPVMQLSVRTNIAEVVMHTRPENGADCTKGVAKKRPEPQYFRVPGAPSP